MRPKLNQYQINNNVALKLTAGLACPRPGMTDISKQHTFAVLDVTSR